MRVFAIVGLLTALSNLTLAQDYNFRNSWESLGPNRKPSEDKKQYSNGIGPVEFIRANKNVEGFLLAGSLNGGLFYTKDGAQQWVNAGSDDWPYSGCGWAQFHPENEKMWFAYSCTISDNGSPGSIGHHGGIYRTKDEGLRWEMIANKSAFLNSEFLTIFGFKFHPERTDQLYVYTSEGLYFTEDCTSDEVKWIRITNLGGWIYDLAFSGGQVYMTQMQFGKWSLFTAELSVFEKDQEVFKIEEMKDQMESVTLCPYGDEVLVLKNFSRTSDEVHLYSRESKKLEPIIRNQRVVFGKGRTFAVSPHRREDLLLGYSTTAKRWNISLKKNVKMNRGYHVDLEGVAFDPFDSMKVYLATHGGVYTSLDNCNSWNSTSIGLGIAESEGLAVSELDPEQIAIGCFHDGSSLRSDYSKNGIYQWKNVNGGDGLLPLQPKNDINTVYTSNQFKGGGLYVSTDTGRTKKNVHGLKGVKTAGWQMAAVLHPLNENMVIFNYQLNSGAGRGNIDICRTIEPTDKGRAERISDFNISHKIPKYSIYGIYNSIYHPNELYVHMIEMTTDENGKPLSIHRLFKTDDCTVAVKDVIGSWYELEIPRSDWIAMVKPDPKSSSKIYLAYVSGIFGLELSDQDYGLIYQLKYKKGKNRLMREMDITGNLPYSTTGRYNLISEGQGGLFFATRAGVYYGDKKTIKGRRDWQKIGFGLPHCRVHGIYYHERTNSLTVGLYGRGVWRYYL